MQPKYFDGEDTAHGFITKGCIRNCYFCKVPKHEGKLRPYQAVQDIVGSFKKAIFMDNNILAWDGANEALSWLVEQQIRCQFNQGLDIRLVNESNLQLLSRLKYQGEYLFAFDDIREKPIIEKQLPLVKAFITQPWKVKFFVYVNAAMEPIETIERILWLKGHECLVYLMRDINCYQSQYAQFYTDLASWCNQPGIFKKLDFETFLARRHKNVERQYQSLALFSGEELQRCEACWQPSLRLFEDDNFICESCLTN